MANFMRSLGVFSLVAAGLIGAPIASNAEASDSMIVNNYHLTSSSGGPGLGFDANIDAMFSSIDHAFGAFFGDTDTYGAKGQSIEAIAGEWREAANQYQDWSHDVYSLYTSGSWTDVSEDSSGVLAYVRLYAAAAGVDRVMANLYENDGTSDLPSDTSGFRVFLDDIENAFIYLFDALGAHMEPVVPLSLKDIHLPAELGQITVDYPYEGYLVSPNVKSASFDTEIETKQLIQATPYFEGVWHPDTDTGTDSPYYWAFRDGLTYRAWASSPDTPGAPLTYTGSTADKTTDTVTSGWHKFLHDLNPANWYALNEDADLNMHDDSLFNNEDLEIFDSSDSALIGSDIDL